MRNVEIKVKHNGNTLPLTGTYTPGVAPTVIRTDATIALHANAQLNNQPLTISVNTFEWNPPPHIPRIVCRYSIVRQCPSVQYLILCIQRQLW